MPMEAPAARPQQQLPMVTEESSQHLGIEDIPPSTAPPPTMAPHSMFPPPASTSAMQTVRNSTNAAIPTPAVAVTTFNPPATREGSVIELAKLLGKKSLSPTGATGAAAPTAAGAESLSSGAPTSTADPALGAPNSSMAVESGCQKIPQLFAPEVGDSDAVLVLPSLDIRVVPEGTGPNSGEAPAAVNVAGTNTATVLPGVGQTSRTPGGGGMAPSNNPSDRPTMAASVLTSATRDAAEAEQEVAQSLKEDTSWNKSTVGMASACLLKNVSESFSRLVDSRMRAWTLLLLRHSLSSGDGSSRKRLMGILAARLQVQACETKFKALPLPPSAAGQQKEADVILPLLFESNMSISSGQGKSESVVLRAPGTISANFWNSMTGTSVLMKEAKIQLDCGALLSCMVEQARIIVLKAVASATKTPVPLNPAAGPSAGSGFNMPSAVSALNMNSAAGFGATSMSMNPPPPSQDSAATNMNPPSSSAMNPPSSMPMGPPSITTAKSLAGFRSALNLTSENVERSPGLQKARSSALRLNSILQGKDSGSSTATLGLRRNRSVRWNTPADRPSLLASKTPHEAAAAAAAENGTNSALFPSAKKSRVSQTAAKLKSFKSFGRPHAGDFGSGPRNATFGEFGDRQHLWGRDGRMTQHPVAMQRLEGAAASPYVVDSSSADRNATFDLSNIHRPSKPSIHLASGGGGSSMPRTATVLENWLLKKSIN